MGREGGNCFVLGLSAISAGIGHCTGFFAGRLLGGSTAAPSMGLQFRYIFGFRGVTNGTGIGMDTKILTGGSFCGAAFIPSVGGQLRDGFQLNALAQGAFIGADTIFFTGNGFCDSAVVKDVYAEIILHGGAV